MGVCCLRAVKKLKADFESRITALEQKMNHEKKKDEYVQNLKECISLRDEQILAMGEQLKAKDELIVEMKQQIVMSNERITEFMAKMEKLSTALESSNKQNNCSRQKSAKMQGKSDTVKGLKAVFNTGYTPLYYTVNIEYPNLKRDLCPFKVEECVIAALGGKSKQITKAGKNGF